MTLPVELVQNDSVYYLILCVFCRIVSHILTSIIFHDLHDAAVNQSVTRCLLNLSDEHAALKLSVTH